MGVLQELGKPWAYLTTQFQYTLVCFAEWCAIKHLHSLYISGRAFADLFVETAHHSSCEDTFHRVSMQIRTLQTDRTERRKMHSQWTTVFGCNSLFAVFDHRQTAHIGIRT